MLSKYRGFWAKLGRIIGLIIPEFWSWVEFFVIYAPNEGIGQTIRRIYWRSFYDIGQDTVICRGAVLTTPDSLEIGHNSIIGEDVAIYVGPCKGVYIGNYVGIGRGSLLRSANHRFGDPDIPHMQQGHEYKVVRHNDRDYSIVIEDDVLISAHTIILSGTKLGKGCVVSAGAVLSGNYPPYSIIAGNPGRIISRREKSSASNKTSLTSGGQIAKTLEPPQ